MKKFILPAIIVLIIIAVYIVIKTVDFGALTIVFLERTANIDIKYKTMQGNPLRGFKIENYNVKLSETDSVYGEIADISYRFEPWGFRLPHLFEINLIEPTVCIKKKTGTGEKTKFSLPRLNLGLRINLKNGKVIYGNEKLSTIEAISGLVFIDLIGSKIYLSTINLSLRTKDYPISITSANLDLTMNNKGIKANSFKIKGNGILLQGEGSYSFENDQASLKFENARLVMQSFGIHKGTIMFSGEAEYINNKLLPKIHGTVEGLEPFDHFNFETNVFADTILVNIFDGELSGGRVFAQVKVLDWEIWEFEANFNEVNIGNYLNFHEPVLVNGYMKYKEKKYIGIVKSPAEYGLGLDSLLIYVSTTDDQINLDSLFIIEGRKTLEIDGNIYAGCDLNIKFNSFDLEKLAKYVPFKGIIKGYCHLQGDLKKMKDILITSNITVTDFVTEDIEVKEFSINSKDFRFGDQSGYLKLTLEEPSYKNQSLEKMAILLENHNIQFEAKRQDDNLKIIGAFDKNWGGTISNFYINYNGVETKNTAPITFDIPNKKLGNVNLSFIDGTLKGSLSPVSISLSNGDLTKFGMLLGLKEDISGTLALSLAESKLTINAQEINFRGLKDGLLTVKGEYKNKTIIVEALDVSDENEQNLHADGLFSTESFFINTKFDDFGIWALWFLNNILGNPDGIMSGDVTFQGNLESFKLTGEAEIQNGSFSLDIVSAKFDSLNSKVKFDNNRIIFESAKGQISTLSNSRLSSSNGAEINAGGVVKLEPRFRVKNLNFDVSFKDAPLQYYPFAYGIGSGNFSFGMKDEVSYYNGNITIKQATIPIDFGLKIKPEKKEDSEKWTMNIRIKGERNIWLRNRDADIEFGGEIYIVKEQGEPYISGIMKTHRGNYYWLNHVLSITEGQVTFIPEEKIDAELNIWAEMDTRERDSDGNTITIILHCFGTMSEPIFEFFTEPEGQYSEQDILMYLNLNISWRELESMKQGDYVGKVLPHGLLSWLEGDVSRRIRQYTGLDYFRIETPYFEPEIKAKLTVGKYVSRDIFITYTYDITSFSNEFNVEYFIDDKNEILIKRDEEGEYSLQYQHRIRF